MIVGLGELAGGQYHGEAFAASADGAIIVGWSMTDDGDEPFIWNAKDGMLSLFDILVDNNVDMTGWKNMRALDISPDGRHIAGYGFNPDGVIEGWLVSTVTEPSSFVLFGIAGIALGIGTWRRRRRSTTGQAVPPWVSQCHSAVTPVHTAQVVVPGPILEPCVCAALSQLEQSPD